MAYRRLQVRHESDAHGLADFFYERCINKPRLVAGVFLLNNLAICSVKIVEKSKFIQKLQALSSTNPKVSSLPSDLCRVMLTILQSARTVVVITYSTLYA